MSNDTDDVTDAGNDSGRQPSRFERVKVEVVSGGTQSVAPAPQADRSMMVLGTVGWLALFVLLFAKSPWTLVFVLGLAVSIMLHELGHFWTARKSGMRATQFFLGFGPRIWSTHRNGVEYGVRAIPLGGFVKIIGMTNVDDVPAEDEQHTYRQASYGRRMWVITAGSAMHAIIAVVLVTVVYVTSGSYSESGRVTVQRVVAGSPADLAGLKTDDIVLSVGGTPVAKDKEVAAALTTSHVPGDSIDLSITRDGTPLTLRATLGQNPNVPEGEVRAFLGISYTSIGLVPMSLASAITQGPKDLVVGVGRATVAIAKVINPVSVYGHLVGTNTDPTTRPGTIVGATNVSSDVGKLDGWVGMLIFLANINLVVGVFNMFPLLPLDGGHAAIATYERLRSRRGKRYYADVNKLMPVAAVCIALLAFMFLTGLYLDTVKG